MKREPSDREPQANVAEFLWLISLSCGLAIGAAIGAAIDRIGAGIGIGLGVGVAVGLCLYRRFKGNPSGT